MPRGHVRLIDALLGPGLAFAAAAILLAGAGGLLTEIGPWYHGLRQSRIKPPDWAFGPVWTVILGLWAYAGTLAWNGAATPADHRTIVILFAVNFAFHLLWSPLFFKFKRPDWALAEMPFLWLSVLAMIVGLSAYSAVAAWVLVPYLVWVTVAGWINLSVVRLNGPFGSRVPEPSTR